MYLQEVGCGGMDWNELAQDWTVAGALLDIFYVCNTPANAVTCIAIRAQGVSMMTTLRRSRTRDQDQVHLKRVQVPEIEGVRVKEGSRSWRSCST
jgi:hypothetical protein